MISYEDLPLSVLLVEVNDVHAIAARRHGVTLRFAEFDQVGSQLQEIANGKLRNLMRFEGWEKPSDLEVDPVLGR